MNDWADLKALRDAGHRPAHMLAVFSGDHWRFRAAMIENGAMVIDHPSGQPIPIELLAGLEVLLMFSRCGEAMEIAKQIRGAKHPPLRCRVWCECMQDLSVIAMKCREAA